ncbi:MAG: hypothetical protein AB7F78_11565 [Hyphomicrobiaceae bacterium]
MISADLSDEARRNLTPAELDRVGGGLNPQPIPPGMLAMLQPSRTAALVSMLLRPLPSSVRVLPPSPC